MPHTTHPRFGQYGVYDARTGELRSTHDTRGQANAAKGLDPTARVRGNPATSLLREANTTSSILGRLFGGRR